MLVFYHQYKTFLTLSDIGIHRLFLRREYGAVLKLSLAAIRSDSPAASHGARQGNRAINVGRQ